jgi:NAD(P)-dependent dehydrogenase (short-subunit alcohol dehydrogenase family)
VEAQGSAEQRRWLLAREGAKVVVADVNVDGGEETVRMIAEAGGEAIFVETDVSKTAEVEYMVEKAVEAYGQLDCAFNNAGIEGTVFVPTADYTIEDWDQVIGVNLTGLWLCMKYEIPQMLKLGGGAIVNTSSVVGLVGGSASGSAYVASKHGVVGLTRAPALEYAQQNIRINVVCPGLIRTQIIERMVEDDRELEEWLAARQPIGRLGAADEVAEAVVWLCSGAASFVTGHAMAVDGGFVAQ